MSNKKLSKFAYISLLAGIALVLVSMLLGGIAASTFTRANEKANKSLGLYVTPVLEIVDFNSTEVVNLRTILKSKKIKIIHGIEATNIRITFYNKFEDNITCTKNGDTLTIKENSKFVFGDISRFIYLMNGEYDTIYTIYIEVPTGYNFSDIMQN